MPSQASGTTIKPSSHTRKRSSSLPKTLTFGISSSPATAMPSSKRAPEGIHPRRLRWLCGSLRESSDFASIRHSGGNPGVLLNHPRIASGLSLGPVLDLGCGTGLVALAIGDLPIESFTGIDLSPRMLAHAKAKRIYAELREADIIADLTRTRSAGR